MPMQPEYRRNRTLGTATQTCPRLESSPAPVDCSARSFTRPDFPRFQICSSRPPSKSLHFSATNPVASPLVADDVALVSAALMKCLLINMLQSRICCCWLLQLSDTRKEWLPGRWRDGSTHGQPHRGDCSLLLPVDARCTRRNRVSRWAELYLHRECRSSRLSRAWHRGGR